MSSATHPTRPARPIKALMTAVWSYLPWLAIIAISFWWLNIFLLPAGLLGGMLDSLPATSYTFVEQDRSGDIITQRVSHDAGAATTLRMQINSQPATVVGFCAQTRPPDNQPLGNQPPSAPQVIPEYTYTFTLFGWTLETVTGPMHNCGLGTIHLATGASYRVLNVPGTE